ncbi:MAG: hypothetical protein ACKPH7_05535, partial [Planktothrix sp.]|uniref:hypothetical protein n=1 Tax=Planktothrix sp. TaxID=3088171 RepID=UPI0038D4D3D5
MASDWDIRIGGGAFVLVAPSKSEAINFVKHQTDVISQWLVNWGCNECRIHYPNCEQPIRIPVCLEPQEVNEMTQSIYLPG